MLKQQAIYLSDCGNLKELNSYLEEGWTFVDMAAEAVNSRWSNKTNGGMVVVIQKAIARSPN